MNCYRKPYERKKGAWSLPDGPREESISVDGR